MKMHLPMLTTAVVASAMIHVVVQLLMPARADQSERVPPTSGIYTGVQFSQLIGDSVRSMSSGNKGSSAPANVGGSAVDGLEWIDDSVSPWLKKRYVNGGWAIEGALDPSDSSYVGVIGGGVASISSASTVDLGSVPQANVTITGTTTVNGFGSSAPTGVVKIVRFDGALTLTHSSSLTVPGSFSLVTAANDRAIVTHLGSGNWEVTQYTRASGVPVDLSALGEPKMTFQALTPALYLPGDGRAITRTSYPAYTSKMTLAQNGTRTSGNATITLSNTDGVGAGMPVEGTGIGSGCTISTFSSGVSITLNSSACVTSSGTSTVSIFLTGYGSGGSSTTIGVPDCQGRVIAGLDGGTGRLTSSYFGSYANAYNVAGGREDRTLSEANLPSLTKTLSLTRSQDVGLTIQFRKVGGFVTGGGNVVQTDMYSGTDVSQNASIVPTLWTQPNFSGTVSFGSGTAHTTVQPTLTARCNVRVIP